VHSTVSKKKKKPDRQCQHSTNATINTKLVPNEVQETHPNIDVESTKIVTEAKELLEKINNRRNGIKNLGENRANRQIGYEIDECWTP
jgi:hypothetical protein